MRRVILNTLSTDALGQDRRVLKSIEDGTRSTNLRGLRLFYGHPREMHAGHLRSGKSAGRAGLPGVVWMPEPTGLGHAGPRRCWQLRHGIASCASANLS
jgi:hypothetical protein